MPSPWEIAALGLALVLAWKTFIWLLSLALGNAGIVDIFWGPGFFVFAGFTAFLSPPATARQYLALVLVAIWGLRLGVHILMRSRGQQEDYRYRAMRERAGQAFWWRSLFIVFYLQGMVLWLVALPVLRAQTSTVPRSLTLLDGLGMLLFAVGFLFESVGDWQLTRFKAKPENKSKLLDTGLWRFTRHPNYFGDALVWWGLFCIGASVPGGWKLLFSPILMTFLLVKVSGVSLLEVKLKETRPGYRDYVARTSSFIPWPPRKNL